MSVIFILLPLALLLAGISLAAFVRAVKRGEYDDLETPAVRMLFDDADLAPRPNENGRPPNGPGGS